MALNTIRFSYPFKKLLSSNNSLIERAMLLQIIKIDLIDLTQEMRDYDTDFGSFPLPAKGKYLMLIFMKPNGGGLFTTIRRSTPPKLEYYQGLTGHWFNIDINHDVKGVEE